MSAFQFLINSCQCAVNTSSVCFRQVRFQFVLYVTQRNPTNYVQPTSPPPSSTQTKRNAKRAETNKWRGKMKSERSLEFYRTQRFAFYSYSMGSALLSGTRAGCLRTKSFRAPLPCARVLQVWCTAVKLSCVGANPALFEQLTTRRSLSSTRALEVGDPCQRRPWRA